MNRYTLTGHNGKKYERITKSEARKIYESATPENGNVVVMCGCKFNPFTPWGGGDWWSYDRFEGVSFDSAVATSEYYGCDSERGRYLAYYKPIEERRKQ